VSSISRTDQRALHCRCISVAILKYRLRDDRRQ
jgi:hypothetical protein